MDLVVIEKIEYSILNGLGYIGRLEKKNGNSSKIFSKGLITIYKENEKWLLVLKWYWK